MYLKIALSFLFVSLLVGLGWYVVTHTTLLMDYADTTISVPTTTEEGPAVVSTSTQPSAASTTQGLPSAAPVSLVATSSSSIETNKGLTQSQLLALAGNPYLSGNLPIGDGRYTTSGPKLGYVYLCSAHKDRGGADVAGPWIHDTVWNILEKIHVSGAVSWPNARFSDTVVGESRTLSGNALPIAHDTGVFPVATDDPAYAYDRNPNFINAQNITKRLPARPVYSETPYCMGGEVGIMLSGVPLFNAFDAELRDAPAHELQDSCDGHPQVSGEYHYHGLSSCIKDISVTTVIGYAYDGFPITGPLVAKNKYLTTEDLDVCHGLSSEIMQDGKKVVSYHYVMTQDFPYSVSCFRGKPVTTGPSVSPTQGQMQAPTAQPKSGPGNPPTEATVACGWKASGDSCAFVGQQGEQISGTCRTPPGQNVLACVPN